MYHLDCSPNPPTCGGQPLPVGRSAALFGLAHWAGGRSYVLLVALVGLGYALAFRASGRIEMAILAGKCAP
jgi:uncharacterized protein